MAVDAKTGQAIYPGVPGVGLSNVGSYQSSGTPWITGSFITAEINSGSVRTYHFPRVAKKIVIECTPNMWYTAFSNGSLRQDTDTVMFYFGESKNIDGTVKEGDDCFIIDTSSPKYAADATSPPTQYSQAHVFNITYMSGTNGSGGSFTSTVRTDHINVAVVGSGGASATGSFQIYAELTNIRKLAGI